MLGEAYRGKQDVKAALGAFERANQLEPKNAWLQDMVFEMKTKLNGMTNNLYYCRRQE
jgi:TolA-binding protein